MLGQAAAPRPAAAAAASATPAAELVVLVHGMGRTSLSMTPLEKHLGAQGYRVLNVFYDSYGSSIPEIGRGLKGRIEAEGRRAPVQRVHFVGHSLGNIVVRWMLAFDPPAIPLGRMVMLAPPNRGAKAADRFAPYVLWLLTPVTELTTSGSTVAKLPAPPQGFTFAIVAAADDRTVSVEETCLAGAAAHVTVPGGHSFIMMRDDVKELVPRFLGSGVMPAGVGRVTCGGVVDISQCK
jgi:pimeloyl-ACP methyl ester carboxylesterase